MLVHHNFGWQGAAVTQTLRQSETAHSPPVVWEGRRQPVVSVALCDQHYQVLRVKLGERHLPLHPNGSVGRVETPQPCPATSLAPQDLLRRAIVFGHVEQGVSGWKDRRWPRQYSCGAPIQVKPGGGWVCGSRDGACDAGHMVA
jgi:hypothetical protein